MVASRQQKITILDLRKKKERGEVITALTAYDYPFAKLFDRAGIDILLVGDSLGMVVHGLPNTLAVTVDDMIYHSRAVARAAQHAHVTVDMPFMSYQVDVAQAVENAGRLVKEGGAESVKLEGGRTIIDAVRRIVAIGIPVIGHLGLTPQSIHAMGGYRIQGTELHAQQQLKADAKLLEDAGASAIVLEGMPAILAQEIAKTVAIPTIGIGAGAGCDGQVLVGYDLLGIDLSFSPKFLRRYAELESTITAATKRFIDDVKQRRFPTGSESF